ncbi:MAG: 30S ribosomal protein S6 [Syntrophales bacterium]
MKRYETLFIVQIDLPIDELNSIIERYSAIVTALKGTIIKVEKWGKRKLAYEIKKQSSGNYVLIDFAGKSAIIDELERNFKIDDKILKFMTIMKDGNVDLAALEKERQEENQPETPRAALVFESRESAVPKIETDTNKDSTSSGSI